GDGQGMTYSEGKSMRARIAPYKVRLWITCNHMGYRFTNLVACCLHSRSLWCFEGTGTQAPFRLLLADNECGIYILDWKRYGQNSTMLANGIKVENQQFAIIIIIDSMTSVFNTDASLPYNHDLFESLRVKRRIKMDGEGTYCCLTTIIPRCLRLQTLIRAIWIENDNKNATDTD
ncbi:hypothetical protein CSKR_201689, partial [Clonorchis sinensis]